MALRVLEWVKGQEPILVLQLWQHAGEDLQAQVILISEAISATLQGANLVVEALDEPQGDLVVRVAVGDDAVPVLLDQGTS